MNSPLILFFPFLHKDGMGQEILCLDRHLVAQNLGWGPTKRKVEVQCFIIWTFK